MTNAIKAHIQERIETIKAAQNYTNPTTTDLALWAFKDVLVIELNSILQVIENLERLTGTECHGNVLGQLRAIKERTAASGEIGILDFAGQLTTRRTRKVKKTDAH